MSADTTATAPAAGQTTSQPQYSIPDVVDAVAAVIGDREVVVAGHKRFTAHQIAERSRRLGAYLHSRGLGAHTERETLKGHESGQDLLGIYAYNGNEYIESMVGAFRARVAPFNVNYRYVREELKYLLADAGASALVYQAAFAPRLAEVLDGLPHLRLLIQIADDSGNELLPGAVDYESIVSGDPTDESRSAAESLEKQGTSPDDLYVLYTGGTTGMPKGVLWRQNDIYMASCGGRNVYTGEMVASLDEVATRAADSPGLKMLIIPPLIHGAAQWAVLTALTSGQTVVFPPVVDRLDTASIAETVEREKPAVLMVVGDAIARPILAEFEKGKADVSSLSIFANGGAVLTPGVKERVLEALPTAVVIDGVGSSETGAQMTHVSTSGAVATGTFNPGTSTCVLTEEMDRVAEPGYDGLGWLAQRGNVPLGYKGDEAKTAKTFPVIAGERFVLPGDRAQINPDGTITLLGRDSVTINSGGEKIFVEEVEMALASHDAVADVLVAGRPSDQWGESVVAIVELVDGAQTDADELLDHASATIARYKLPKSVLFVPAIMRSPVGKADYRWAREQAAALGTH